MSPRSDASRARRWRAERPPIWNTSTSLSITGSTSHVLPIDDGVALYYRDVTSRRQAEQLRDQSRLQLQQAFDAITDGVIAVNREWTITFLNSSALRTLEPIGEMVGRHIWDSLPMAGDILHQNYSRTMTERVPTTFETFYGAPLNGWYSVECRPSDDGIVIFFSDITEQRKAEESIREQQVLLTNVQQAALVATWEVEFPSGRVTFGSGSYPVFGRPLSEFQTRFDVQQFIPPQQVEKILETAREALRTRAPFFSRVPDSGRRRTSALDRKPRPDRLRRDQAQMGCAASASTSPLASRRKKRASPAKSDTVC